MTPADRRFRRIAKGTRHRWLAAPVLLASNWLFQGWLILAPSERWFKAALGASLTALFAWPLLAVGLVPWVAVVAAFLAAHTIDWLVDGQLPVVLKNLGWTRVPPDRLERELARLSSRASGRRWVLAVHGYGSLARGEATPRSDLDVRVLRAPGFAAGWSGCWFVLSERARATARLFPLDIYLVDRPEDLGGSISKDELRRPVVLVDQTGRTGRTGRAAAKRAKREGAGR